MPTGFVVLEVGYEYNDQTYYQPESGGGKPVHIFTSKKRAEEVALQLAATKLRNLDPTEYGNNWEDVSTIKQEELKKKLQEIFPNQKIHIGSDYMELVFKCGIEKHHRLYQAIGKECPCEKDAKRHGSHWPGDVTNEQLLRVAALLNGMELYVVEEIDID
jgi:hypothetical protein